MVATASFAAESLKKLPLSNIKADLDFLPLRSGDELRETGGAYKLFAFWAQESADA
jgi:hypothetical protein